MWQLSVGEHQPILLNHGSQDDSDSPEKLEATYWGVYDDRNQPQQARKRHRSSYTAASSTPTADKTGCLPWKAPTLALCRAISQHNKQGQSTARVVELGCGIGSVGLFLASRVDRDATVVLTDVDEQALAFAHSNISRHKLQERVSVQRHEYVTSSHLSQ